MAKPAYIVCADSVAVDFQSNRISHFNIVEGLVVERHPLPKGSVPEGVGAVEFLSFAVVAVWVREKRDRPTDEFRYELSMRWPGAKKQTVLKGSFVFSKPRHRLITRVKGLPPAKSGELTIESRIKKKGAPTWISQQYTLPVEIRDTSTNGENGKPSS